MYFTEDKNTGLPSKFVLSASGGFLLTGGTEKVNDNVHMILAFNGFFRIYAQDFVPALMILIQKPVSVILSLKTLILSRLLKTFSKYVEYAQVSSISLVYENDARKKIGIALEYTYKLDPKISNKLVTYLNV